MQNAMFVAGNGGTHIPIGVEAYPSAEDCAAESEEQKMIGGLFYLARKEDATRRCDCTKCNRAHCPEQIHMAGGHLGKKRLDTRRGSGNDLCLGCG